MSDNRGVSQRVANIRLIAFHEAVVVKCPCSLPRDTHKANHPGLDNRGGSSRAQEAPYGDLQFTLSVYHRFSKLGIPQANIRRGNLRWGGGVMSTSKLQRMTSRALSDAFGGYTIRENSRPAWCLSTELTRLELDFIIEELGVAVEVQGKQHFEHVPFFHPTLTDFERRKRHDDEKAAACIVAGIRLMEVCNEDDIDGVINKIRELRDYYAPAPRETNANWVKKLRHYNSESMLLLKQISTVGHSPKTLHELKKMQSKLTLWVSLYGTAIFDQLTEQHVQETMRQAQKMHRVLAQAEAARDKQLRRKHHKYMERQSQRRKNKTGGAS